MLNCFLMLAAPFRRGAATGSRGDSSWDSSLSFAALYLELKGAGNGLA